MDPVGSFRLLLVSSASMVAEIFKTNDLNFASGPVPALEDRILLGSAGFIAGPYGDYWRFMKKLCMTELLGARQIERSKNVRREELILFLRKMMEKARKHEIVDVGEELMTLTNNTTCKMAMSRRCSGKHNEAQRCRELVKKSVELSTKMTLANVVGPFRRFVLWVYAEEASDVTRRFYELLEKLLNHEERTAKAGGQREEKDLMDILLEIYHDENAEVRICRDQMKAFLLEIFLGGTSTTADTMQWVFAELINHPTIFKKVREEIESVVGRNKLVDELEIPSLKYLHAVVNETMRLLSRADFPLPKSPT